MTQQQCGKWIHGLTTILELALKSSEMLPAKTMKEFIAVLEKQGGANASIVMTIHHDDHLTLSLTSRIRLIFLRRESALSGSDTSESIVLSIA